MASRFFTYVNNLIAGQTARAEDVNASFSSVDGGFASVEAEMNRAFRFTDGVPAKTDFEFAEGSAARAGKGLGFDGSGNPSLLNLSFRWRSDWQASTAYSVNDVVREPNYGSLYLCATAHTSGIAWSDEKWSLMVDMEGVTKSVITHQLITGSRNAVAGDDLMVDVSSGNVTITLPGSPVITDQPINIMHVGGEIGVDGTLTIARNGRKIMGLSENMSVTTPNASFGLAYCNEAYGWRIRGV